MENYQQSDGSILIPKALRPYMDNQDKITKNYINFSKLPNPRVDTR
mgnify:CR=1 FL=1